MSFPVVIIDLLRHGETVAGQRFIGSTDKALTQAGLQQMQWVRAFQYDTVISSPLKRCVDFAHQLTPACIIEPDFREIDFGEWENRRGEELWLEDQQALSAFWSDPITNTPPGGEPFEDFIQRVSQRFDAITTIIESGHHLLVCHGGVIRALLCHLLEMPHKNINRLQIDHGSLSRIEITRDENRQYFRVLFTNKTAAKD